MRDLIELSFNIDGSKLQVAGEVLFIDHSNAYTYIIPVGKEKTSTFFHLLNFVNVSPHFKHIFTVDNAPTLIIRDTHFYCLYATIKLHQTITQSQLNVPVLYTAKYPLAFHYKEKWLEKNQRHEDNVNLALDKTPPLMRAVLFDLATYYIHLNEEAYRLLATVEQSLFSTSLCHARLKPDTPLYEFFMPEYLILDNRSRIYCEYLRHLYLETQDLAAIHRLVNHIATKDPLTEAEWHFLYARLFFPTHFYDVVYDIIIHGKVNLDQLYDQTLNYSKFLAMLPSMVLNLTGIKLDTPSWCKSDQYI